MRAGSDNLNSVISVGTAFEDKDLAGEDWSDYEQKTPPYVLRGNLSKVVLAAVRGGKTLAELAEAHRTPHQITDWKNPLLRLTAGLGKIHFDARS
jgi:hypothetical protein